MSDREEAVDIAKLQAIAFAAGRNGGAGTAPDRVMASGRSGDVPGFPSSHEPSADDLFGPKRPSSVESTEAGDGRPTGLSRRMRFRRSLSHTAVTAGEHWRRTGRSQRVLAVGTAALGLLTTWTAVNFSQDDSDRHAANFSAVGDFTPDDMTCKTVGEYDVRANGALKLPIRLAGGSEITLTYRDAGSTTSPNRLPAAALHDTMKVELCPTGKELAESITIPGSHESVTLNPSGVTPKVTFGGVPDAITVTPEYPLWKEFAIKAGDARVASPDAFNKTVAGMGNPDSATNAYVEAGLRVAAIKALLANKRLMAQLNDAERQALLLELADQTRGAGIGDDVKVSLGSGNPPLAAATKPYSVKPPDGTDLQLTGVKASLTPVKG